MTRSEYVLAYLFDVELSTEYSLVMTIEKSDFYKYKYTLI